MARRLTTYGDVRRYLAGLVNRVEANEITPEKAGKLTYISCALLKAIESEWLDMLDKRLKVIEEEQNAI
jgi:hypothetical protein